MRATVMRGGQATAKTRWPDSLERWLVQHPDRVALGVLALGVLVRLAFALLTYLNPDEIMRVLAADRASLADVYRHDIENPHPPLLSLLLFFWRFLGRSDLLLRLLPVLAGGATLWFSYRWLKSAFDARTGLVALLLLAFSPSMVVIGFEIRPYAVELTAVAVALFALERGLREAKPGYILLFCLAQSLAICSHYSALLFVLAAGVFVLAGLMARRLPRRVALAWIAGQLFTVGVLALLYVVHISRLIGGQRETVLREEYLRNLYFSPGADSLVGFLATRLLDLFRYVGAARQGGLAMLPLAAFAGGIGLLLFRRPRQVWNALFMALPFVAAAVVAALGLYPFGGTRHLSFLILFGVAGASVTVAALTGRRLWPLLAAALVLMPLWELFGGWMMMGGYVKPGVYRRSRIAAAVKYVREVTPLGGIVFSDLQTQLMLKRYLWNGRGEAEATYPEGMYGFRTTGYHLVGLRDWRFVSPRFGDDFSRLVETYGVVPGTPVTVVSSEWFYPHLADELKLQGTEYPGTRTFGPRISVFTAVAGTQVVGESTAAAVSRRRGVLDSLLDIAGRELGGRVRTAVWPGSFLDNQTRRWLAGLADEVLSFADLTDSLAHNADAAVRCLPALAFRVYGSSEPAPEKFRFLRSPAVVSDRVRFSLVAADPESTVGVYIIDAPTADALTDMARRFPSAPPSQVRAVLWPGRYFWLAEELAVGQPGGAVVPYRVLKRALERGDARLDDLLPALAFWEFGTDEAHPEVMSGMDEARDHSTAGYSFTLLGIDRAGVLGVYVIQPAR